MICIYFILYIYIVLCIIMIKIIDVKIKNVFKSDGKFIIMFLGIEYYILFLVIVVD